MSDSKVVVSRTTPVLNTHLTELQLQEMWYRDMEKLDPNSNHRAIGRLFPRSRRDLIEYYTQKDLEINGDRTAEHGSDSSAD